MKIINSKKSKLTRKQYFMILGTMVASLSFTAPVLSIKALAAEDEEVLFEDQEDDYKTEDIKEDDVVQDNTVVESESAKEETKHEEQKQEEENKNDGGSCVTPDKGYDEKAGENWDPEIKTESEKKHRKPVAPPLAEFIPRTPETTPEELLKYPEPNPTQETRQVPQQPTPASTPAPAPAPKTGDITMNELYALLAGLAVGANTIGMVAGKVAKNIRRKR